MAKKETKKVNATQEETATKAVRLDLTVSDHARLDRQAKKRGLTKASYSRMIILEHLDEEEGTK